LINELKISEEMCQRVSLHPRLKLEMRVVLQRMEATNGYTLSLHEQGTDKSVHVIIPTKTFIAETREVAERIFHQSLSLLLDQWEKIYSGK